MGNPVFVFCSVWGGVLLLYCLGATTNLVPMNMVGLTLIVMNMISVLVIYLVLGGSSGRADPETFEKYKKSATVYLKILFWLWLIGTCYEVTVQRGFPLYWNYIGDGRLYTDFGIPSFHGIMNAMYLQVVTVLAYLYFLRPRFRYVLLILLLLCWPVMMLGRGILLSAIIQIVAVFFLMRTLGLRVIITLLISAITAIFLFGYVGDLRQVLNPFAYLVSPGYVDFFSALPSGFLWFYVYLTSGTSNLFYNVELVEPAYSFGYSVYNLIPSALKVWFGFDQRSDLFVFVDGNLNAATFYSGFVSDFGSIGAFLIVFFIQFCCCLTYVIAKKGRPWGIFAYAVAFQILIFSIFYDMFFLLPILFQFVLAMTYCFFYKVFNFKKRHANAS
ncbi:MULTISPECIES: O-antigen polymerase [unclassified Pseudomonas]|uniref:O-antigen polymerase n=1 Tax=unclassified Pseudomonas TaxID=196821 RepID=UPI0015A2D170|nr:MULTISPECIES: O-antigen polymerase [unclassified Pseudomonas]NWC95264.1 oligosaccharide repeat unit polymerase [Pseudomonas sp. IPO3779]NWD17136.1 oligosaccharide repeat unit polymerase [Pseudomonas sp. IPO3778]